MRGREGGRTELAGAGRTDAVARRPRRGSGGARNCVRTDTLAAPRVTPPLLDDGLLDQGPELVAKRDPLGVPNLDHVQRDELLLGIDPEQGPGIAGPPILAHRARDSCDAGIAPPEPGPKPSPWPAGKSAEVVGHELDGLLSEGRTPFHFAAIQEHGLNRR